MSIHLKHIVLNVLNNIYFLKHFITKTKNVCFWDIKDIFWGNY